MHVSRYDTMIPKPGWWLPISLMVLVLWGMIGVTAWWSWILLSLMYGLLGYCATRATGQRITALLGVAWICTAEQVLRALNQHTAGLPLPEGFFPWLICVLISMIGIHLAWRPTHRRYVPIQMDFEEKSVRKIA